MPYKHAHWWAVLVAVVTVVGFWPSYFMVLKTSPLAFHAHAVTALVWIGLAGLQSWSIHHRRRELHRTVGKASFVLFPLLMASFVGIINLSAGRFMAGDNPFFQIYAPVFGWAMTLALIAYLVLYTQALRHRRNTWWHAGFMFSTLLVLFESPFSRIVEKWIPGMEVTGPENVELIGHQIAGSMLLAALFALGVWALHRRRAMPFLVVAGLMVVQAMGMYLVAPRDEWRALFALYAQVPGWLTVGAGALAGVLAAWIGWRYPASPGSARRADVAPRVPISRA